MRWEYSDGGRAAAGYKGEAQDCVTRAIAVAAQLDYSDVYNALATWPRKIAKNKAHKSPREGIMTNTKWFKEYMASIGWQWTPTMTVGKGCTVHLKASELPRGRLIVAVSRHYCAVIDGVLYDNHDCSRDETRCVYGYWSKIPTQVVPPLTRDALRLATCTDCGSVDGHSRHCSVRLASSLTDAHLRTLWLQAGGSFHGPNVEHGIMPESKLLPLLRRLIRRGNQS